MQRKRGLLIAPRPFDLPDAPPKYGRPINPAKVEWLNLGDPDATEANLKVEVTMPNGESNFEKFSVPLAYHQPEIDSLKRKERKDKTVLIYTRGN